MPRRFYISPDAITSDTATLEGAEAHHLLHVMRLKRGARIELFDGCGNLYEAEISATGRDKLSLEVLSKTTVPRPAPELHLATALLKGKKMEFVLQKAVELGIAAMHPFIATHCDRQSAKGDATVNRWQRIILEACKQCGQTLLPAIAAPVSFAELLQHASLYGHILLCHEKETKRRISDLPFQTGAAEPILLVIGPEGGFSDDEIDAARQKNCSIVSLGPLTLRAETAAIAAIAIVQHRLGHIG